MIPCRRQNRLAMRTEPPPGAEIREFAPAKINLALHVTGQREDGFHLLDSLVAFVDTGDWVAVCAGDGLMITGPEADGLDADESNLCWRAARAMGGDVAIRLDKHLPVASGIGGGSADAAATMRALARIGRRLPDQQTVLSLGADVPACLSGQHARMQGIGERLSPVQLPPLWLVLVNSRVAVATSSVFQALTNRNNPPMQALPAFADARALAAWLSRQRNDLEAPARRIVPEINAVLDALAVDPACLLARMSGSGATCFGLYATADTAETAAGRIAAARPGWWVRAAPLRA